MEKKGNILTQLALISDLLEKVNMESDKIEVMLPISRTEFERLAELMTRKAKTKLVIIDDTFMVKIGVVEYVFVVNTNSA